jgi:hypothetical protein
MSLQYSCISLKVSSIQMHSSLPFTIPDRCMNFHSVLALQIGSNHPVSGRSIHFNSIYRFYSHCAQLIPSSSHLKPTNQTTLALTSRPKQTAHLSTQTDESNVRFPSVFDQSTATRLPGASLIRCPEACSSLGPLSLVHTSSTRPISATSHPTPRSHPRHTHPEAYAFSDFNISNFNTRP